MKEYYPALLNYLDGTQKRLQIILKKSEYKNVKKAIEMRDIYPLFKNTGQNNVYNNKKNLTKTTHQLGYHISHLKFFHILQFKCNTL